MPEDTEDLLRDIRRWVKIIGIQEAKPVLADALTHQDDEKQRDLRIAFHLTDGSHSTREIATHIDYEFGWVSSRQSEWSKMGLVEQEGSNSPYRKVITLEEAGIDVPPIPDSEGDS